MAPPRFVSGWLDTARLLESAVDRILADLPGLAPVDVALVTGNVSDDGSPESYAIARRQLDRLGLPLLVLPGNHDRRDPLRRAFADTVAMPETGPIDWAVEIGDLRIIGLDTLVEGRSGGTLADGTLARLSTALRGAAGRPVLVAMHHPPVLTGIGFMDRIGLDRRSEILSAMSAADGPARIVAGHVHVPLTGALGATVVCTAPSVCSGFPLDLEARGPARVHDGSAGLHGPCLERHVPFGLRQRRHRRRSVPVLKTRAAMPARRPRHGARRVRRRQLPFGRGWRVAATALDRARAVQALGEILLSGER